MAKARPQLPAVASRSRVSGGVRCFASKDGQGNVAAPAIAALAALAILSSATFPEDALAARSGGRVGGSGFSSRRAAPPSQSRGPTIRNYNYNSAIAPPIYGGYGFSPFGFGGVGIMPMMPFGMFGTIFQIMILFFIVNTVLNVVRSFGKKDRDDL